MKKILSILCIIVCVFVIAGCGEDKPKAEPKVAIKIENGVMTIPEAHTKFLQELGLSTISVKANKDQKSDLIINALNDKLVDVYSIRHYYGEGKIYLRNNEIERVMVSMIGYDGERELYNVKSNKKISFQEAFKPELAIKQIHEQETAKQNKEREAAITDLMKHLNGDRASVEIIYDVIQQTLTKMPRIKEYNPDSISADFFGNNGCRVQFNVRYNSGAVARLRVTSDGQKITDIKAFDAKQF